MEKRKQKELDMVQSKIAFSEWKQRKNEEARERRKQERREKRLQELEEQQIRAERRQLVREMQKRQGHGNGQILLSYSLNKNLK